jgi:uncharacterized protein (DUF924 family)
MARGYDRQFLIDAYMSRFIKLPYLAIEALCELEENAEKLYDRVGKDEFRTYASLDAEAIRKFKLES